MKSSCQHVHMLVPITNMIQLDAHCCIVFIFLVVIYNTHKSKVLEINSANKETDIADCL